MCLWWCVCGCGCALWLRSAPNQCGGEKIFRHSRKCSPGPLTCGRYAPCELWQLGNPHGNADSSGAAAGIGSGYLPLTCGDAGGNGNATGNGDGMPFTL